MKARRYSERRGGGLPRETQALLLFGWGEWLDALRADGGEVDHNVAFGHFELTRADLERLFRRHQVGLLTEWHRRGEVGTFWAAQCAAGTEEWGVD
jgi:hypothetical protein